MTPSTESTTHTNRYLNTTPGHNYSQLPYRKGYHKNKIVEINNLNRVFLQNGYRASKPTKNEIGKNKFQHQS